MSCVVRDDFSHKCSYRNILYACHKMLHRATSVACIKNGLILDFPLMCNVAVTAQEQQYVQ